MSQELVQVQREKTFEELCPEWTIMMKHGLKRNDVCESNMYHDIPHHRLLSISRPACCVVAEAYGWSDDYSSTKRCDQCVSFSNRFCFTEFWDALRPEFAEHWNKCHR